MSYTDSFGPGKTAETASTNAVVANPPPEFANPSATFTVNENATSGTVGTVTATDPDNEAITYSVGGAGATAFNQDFSLGSTSGRITVKPVCHHRPRDQVLVLRSRSRPPTPRASRPTSR